MLRQIASALFPVALIWAAFITFAIVADARWPDDGSGWIAFVALCTVTTFLLLVSTIMLRRMRGKDHLTLALAFAFATTALMPLFIMGAARWPVFYRDHRFVLLVLTAGILIIGSLVAIVALILTPDNGGQREEGYAAGVAQEQKDQLKREGNA